MCCLPAFLILTCSLPQCKRLLIPLPSFLYDRLIGPRPIQPAHTQRILSRYIHQAILASSFSELDFHVAFILDTNFEVHFIKLERIGITVCGQTTSRPPSGVPATQLCHAIGGRGSAGCQLVGNKGREWDSQDLG